MRKTFDSHGNLKLKIILFIIVDHFSLESEQLQTDIQSKQLQVRTGYYCLDNGQKQSHIISTYSNYKIEKESTWPSWLVYFLSGQKSVQLWLRVNNLISRWS